MKIIFMGTPQFSVNALINLSKKHEIICVYTQPPRPAGKGYKLIPSAVQQMAEQLNIPVRTPVSFKNEQDKQDFIDLNADLAVVCAYGLILPTPILTGTKMGCINIHASLLPRWRGAAPIQRAIEAGDDESGVTIMQMDKGLDTGNMLLKGSVKITPKTTGGMLHDALSDIGAKLIVDVLDNMPTPVVQPTEGITYAEKLQKTEALIDWTQPASVIQRKIMAFNPVMCAYFMYKNDRVKVFEAHVSDKTHNQPCGTVLDESLAIACGENTVLNLDVLQRAGKNKMNTNDFLKGTFITSGESLAL